MSKIELSESIFVEPDGSRSVLVAFNGDRCHAKIVDEVPTDGDWYHTGYTSMGYDIYHKKATLWNPYDFVAIKKGKYKMKEQAHVLAKDLLSGKTVNESFAVMESSESEDKVTALLKFLNYADTEENRDRVSKAPYGKNVYCFDGDDNTFLICTSDEADEEYYDSVMNLIDDVGLAAFPQDVIDYILNHFTDEEIFLEYYRDDTESYAKDIKDEEDDPMEIIVDGEDVVITNRLFKECIECGAIDPDALDLSDIEDGNYVGDEDLVELYCYERSDPEHAGYDDVFDWFFTEFDNSFFTKFVEENDAVDWDAAIEWLNGEYGRGEELSHWDGTEYEEEVNRKTYYIYPGCDFHKLEL